MSGDRMWWWWWGGDEGELSGEVALSRHRKEAGEPGLSGSLSGEEHSGRRTCKGTGPEVGTCLAEPWRSHIFGPGRPGAGTWVLALSVRGASGGFVVGIDMPTVPPRRGALAGGD